MRPSNRASELDSFNALVIRERLFLSEIYFRYLQDLIGVLESKQMKLYLSLTLLLVFSLSVFAQAKKPLPKPKPPVIKAENSVIDAATPANKKDFSIEAIVVYPSGEVVPISRSTFYILDTDLLTILKNAEIQPIENTLQIFKGDTDKALISDAGYSLSGKYSSPYSELAEKVSKTIKAHIVQQITTDSQGKGTFKRLDGENYYLFGTGGTRFSNVIWNMKIDTTTNSSIILDQNNAASAY